MDTFWQQKLSPKQLIIDWDKFIVLFDEWILETISLKLNHLQKQFIKSLIDPEGKNLVYKNSYLLFVKNFWELPSNRTKLLKGQLNLSKMSKPLLSYDPNSDDKVLLKVHYLPDAQTQEIPQAKHGLFTQKVFQFRKNKLYTMDPQFNIISQKIINTQNFLTLGRSEQNDISIHDCSNINSEHLKLIKMVAKKKKEKKAFYMFDEDENKNETQNLWYVRDISRSNRLQYLLNNETTYIVMRPGMVIKIGLTDQFEIHVIKGTPEDINEQTIKQINNMLNTDRINYLGELDPSIPQKYILDFPINSVKPSDIQTWFNKGYHYEENFEQQVKKNVSEVGQEEDLPLILQLKDTVTQQVKGYKFVGESVKVGRNSKLNKMVIDKVNVRNVECEFVCITGVWMIKNVKENILYLSDQLSQQNADENIRNLHKRLKIKQLSVGLSTGSCVEDLQSSNRILLPSNSKHEFGGKNFIIEIGLRQQQQK